MLANLEASGEKDPVLYQILQESMISKTFRHCNNLDYATGKGEKF